MARKEIELSRRHGQEALGIKPRQVYWSPSVDKRITVIETPKDMAPTFGFRVRRSMRRVPRDGR